MPARIQLAVCGAADGADLRARRLLRSYDDEQQRACARAHRRRACSSSSSARAPPHRARLAPWTPAAPALTRRRAAGVPVSSGATAVPAVSSTRSSSGGITTTGGIGGGGGALASPSVGTAAPGRNWKDVVCPMGGAHEWEFMHRGGAPTPHGAAALLRGVAALQQHARTHRIVRPLLTPCAARAVVSAGAVTGTAGVCSAIFCWPLLFCLPLVWVGTKKGVKSTSDRKCLRCGMVVTHDGRSARARGAQGGARALRCSGADAASAHVVLYLRAPQ
jgi:hypothetical protein